MSEVGDLRLVDDTGLINISQFTDLQKKVMFTDDYMVAWFGGINSGKTAAIMADCLILSLTIPNNRGWICRQTGEKLDESVVKEFFGLLGTTAREARSHPLVKYWNMTKRDLTFKNGSEVKFVSLESEDSAKGPNLGFYVVDQAEDSSELTIMDLDGRCRLGRVPERAWRAYISGNPAPGWCKRTFKDRNGSFKDFTFYEVTTEELVAIKGRAFLDRQLRNRPQWWIDRYVYGGWGSREGQVFHKFSRDQNTITRKKFNGKFKDSWPVIGGYDHGSNSSHPCAILYITWDQEEPDTFYLFRGKKKNLNVDDFAKVIKDEESRFPRNPILRRVADIDTFGQRGIGTPAAAYLEQGVGLVKCNKKPHYLNEAIATVNGLFGDKKLIVVDDLLDVLDELEGWEYKEQRGGILDNAPAKINDDYCKTILYLSLELQIEFGVDLRAETHRITEISPDYYMQHLCAIGVNDVTGY